MKITNIELACCGRVRQVGLTQEAQRKYAIHVSGFTVLGANLHEVPRSRRHLIRA
jgi:hypothetical protein